MVKEIDTQGANRLQIKADLSLIDYARFFRESRGVGVKYDDYVDLMVFSVDPKSHLERDCNKTSNQANWPKCAVKHEDPGFLGSCGVKKWKDSATCNFEVNTNGIDKVYLVFRTADAWLADIEGVLSNLQVCYK